MGMKTLSNIPVAISD